jgi:DNA-binding CsgD family transcriptional regulator
VPALARGDAERLLRFVAEAESFGGDHPFAGEFLTQLGRLVSADWVGYADCAGCCDDGPGPHFYRPGDEGVFSGHLDWPKVKPVLDEESPVVQGVFNQGCFDAIKLSDFLSRRELHRKRMYHLILKPCGFEDSLYVRLRISSPRRPKVFLFDRGGRDFSARDSAVLDVLNPYLVQVYRASESRRRLGAALAAHESTRAAVVLLEDDERISFASTRARELLDRYFGGMTVPLPDLLASWLRERRRGTTDELLRVAAGDRSLVVDVADDALLLEEQLWVPRLTPREREILGLVAEGRTNAEIAERLCVSPGTVRRHLENIFRKLGVHTRTAAAAFVRERRLHARGPAADLGS